jgi:hypothetical protein
MEAQDSFLYSQEVATEPCESNPRLRTVFLKVHFNISLARRWQENVEQT